MGLCCWFTISRFPVFPCWQQTDQVISLGLSLPNWTAPIPGIRPGPTTHAGRSPPSPPSCPSALSVGSCLCFMHVENLPIQWPWWPRSEEYQLDVVGWCLLLLGLILPPGCLEQRYEKLMQFLTNLFSIRDWKVCRCISLLSKRHNFVIWLDFFAVGYNIRALYQELNWILVLVLLNIKLRNLWQIQQALALQLHRTDQLQQK